MNFDASLDTTALVITSGVLLLAAYFLFRSIKAHLHHSSHLIRHYSITALLLIIIGICFMYSVRYYSVGKESLIIHRIGGNVVIKLHDIESARFIAKPANGLRTFGVGGLFGYFGQYHFEQIGDTRLYTTWKENLVVLDLKSGERVAISPDDLKFIDRLESQL